MVRCNRLKPVRSLDIMSIPFQNTYTTLPERFFSKVLPAKVPAPKLISFNSELAKELNLDLSSLSDEDLAQYFSGSKIFESSDPIATAYGGHQFGHFSILGDGRAHLLGEVISQSGERFDIQLKGSGQTPYSRRGDGKSSIGPVIREYILSEAMHALGIPTTRALACVTTGETVYRQEGHVPGGVFTRVAPSHIRVGSFELFYAQQDTDGVKQLLDYTVARHFPDLRNSPNKALAFVKRVASLQADLVAQWMSLGFIHGVMNTDNMSVAGVTIDYGPCAFMDHFNFSQVYSFIDRNARYAYNAQISIAQWNLSRLAQAIASQVDPEQETAIEILNKELQGMGRFFDEAWTRHMAKKFGLDTFQDKTHTGTSGDANNEKADESREETRKLIISYLEYLHRHSLDYTNSFRELSKSLKNSKVSDFFVATPQLTEFWNAWRSCLMREGIDADEAAKKMDSANPAYIPRNHQVEKVIQAAFQGDYQPFERLKTVLANPYTERAEDQDFSLPPEPSEIVENTFCGT